MHDETTRLSMGATERALAGAHEARRPLDREVELVLGENEERRLDDHQHQDRERQEDEGEFDCGDAADVAHEAQVQALGNRAMSKMPGQPRDVQGVRLR